MVTHLKILNTMTQVTQSDKIIKWIKEHDLVTIKRLCEQVGIDQSYLSRCMASNKIPEKFISKIEDVLQKYGYK